MEPVMPFVLYFSAAIIISFIKGRFRSAVAIIFSLFAFANIFYITPQRSNVFIFSGFEVILFHADKLNLSMAYIFSLITILISVFTFNIKDNKHYPFMFIYAGSAMGILFSGDFLSFFLFWEIMMIAAVVLISLNREKLALRAAFKYLLMHLAGGGILLAGILLYYHYTKSMDLSVIENNVPSILILIGIGLNAAFLPIHTWLPDAYSRSPVSSSLILTVFTTKIAVYALARIFPGTEALIIMGLCMALFGSVFALLRTDVRQILSYLMISSIGYMITGIGAGGTEGINAAFVYAWNHILNNTLLFMCIGVIVHSKGKQELSALGGLIKNMPLTAYSLIIGTLAMAGLPLFNGFVSKTLIYGVLYDSYAAYLILKIASFLITLSAIRIMYIVLLGRSSNEVYDAPKHMTLPIMLIALTVVAGGAAPHIFVAPLPNNPDLPAIYTFMGIAETLILFFSAVLIFWAARKKIKVKNLQLYDFDNIYKLILKEAMLFTKDPILVASSWLDFIHSYIYFVQARLFTFNLEQNLSASQGCAQAARQKRIRVSASTLKIDLLTIGSALFLTALVVMVFLLFMFFRKI